MVDISDLVGKTFTKVDTDNQDFITFLNETGKGYKMHHSQDCCESVTIEEIHGDLTDLQDAPILEARADSNTDSSKYDVEEWTFYNIRTIKGSVTIRWYGTSNGYYSTSVDFDEVK